MTTIPQINNDSILEEINNYISGADLLSSQDVRKYQRVANSLFKKINSIQVRPKGDLPRDLILQPFSRQAIIDLSDKHDTHLGEGRYKEVHYGVDVCNGQVVAVAKIRKVKEPVVKVSIHLQWADSEDPVKLELQIVREFVNNPAVEREISMMESLKEMPNIVNFHFSISQPKSYLILMEACQFGDLLNLIEQDKIYYPEEQFQIMRDCLLGLNQLHELNIVHRDIKPENIFIQETDDLPRAKIGDFGFAVRESEVEEAETFKGTREHLSPEKVTCVATQNKRLWAFYGKAGDVWAMGTVFYMLYTRSWLAESTTDISNLNQDFVYSLIDSNNAIPKVVKELLKGMLTIDPKDRWTAREAHEYVQTHEF